MDVGANRLNVVPSAAVGVTLTGTGFAWTNTPWVEVVASTPTAWVLCGAVPNSPNSKVFNLDIGVGAAGSEQVIATLAGYGDSTTVAGAIHLAMPIDAIPQGSRVAIRMRQGSAVVQSVTWALLYYEKPLAGTVTTTTAPTVVLPNASAAVFCSLAGTAWANGPWAEIVPSTAGPITLAGIVSGLGGSAPVELDIGVGAAGSEAVLTTVRFDIYNWRYPSTLMLPIPRAGIASGARVAIRTRSSVTNPLLKNSYLLVGYQGTL